MAKLNEEVVRSLPAPASGNRVTYFGDAVLQGARAPRDFGVRVTAGIRSFVMNYRVAGVERRIAIGQHPDWPVRRAVKQARELRQQIDRCRGDQAQRYRADARQDRG
jgi:Arm DNA-binding domain